MSSPPPGCVPTTSLSLGNPYIRPCGSCASTMPSECSSSESPGSRTVSFCSYAIPTIRPRGMPRARSSTDPPAVFT